MRPWEHGPTSQLALPTKKGSGSAGPGQGPGSRNSCTAPTVAKGLVSKWRHLDLLPPYGPRGFQLLLTLPASQCLSTMPTATYTAMVQGSRWLDYRKTPLENSQAMQAATPSRAGKQREASRNGTVLLTMRLQQLL